MKRLLAAWDIGRRQNAAARGITLLRIAFPRSSRAALGELTPGQRDRHLLTTRRALFGEQAPALTQCPECGGSLEIDLPIGAFESKALSEELVNSEFEWDGYRIRFRLPNCKDLLFVAQTKDVTGGKRLLFERCVEAVAASGGHVHFDFMPASLADEVSRRMEEMDSQGDVRLALQCPACSAEWPALFDIASFLWVEVDAWAVRLLHQVHALARAYGWREKDILAMSDARRGFYLDLVSE